MTCRRNVGGCGAEFCWLCLADYGPIVRDGNHRHQETCQYYAPERGEVIVERPTRGARYRR